MKFFLLLLGLLLRFSFSIKFKLNSLQEYCLAYNNTIIDSRGYISMHASGDINQTVFKILTPIGDGWLFEEEKHIFEEFTFNETGLYQFCAQNLESEVKIVGILIENMDSLNLALSHHMNGTDSYLDKIYEMIHEIFGSTLMKENIEENYVSLMIGNIQKNKWCVFVKILVVTLITITQIYVLKHFLNRKK